MRDRNIRRPQARNVSTAEVTPLNWRYFMVLLICGCVLAAGFFFAARQHFTSMEYGINNSKLRKQLEDLESENRRLRHSREVSMSPGEIKKVARNLGFREIQTGVVMTATATEVKANGNPVVATAKRTEVVKTAGLVRTAYQRPSTDATASRQSTGEGIVRPIKKSEPVAAVRERREITTIAKLR